MVGSYAATCAKPNLWLTNLCISHLLANIVPSDSCRTALFVISSLALSFFVSFPELLCFNPRFLSSSLCVRCQYEIQPLLSPFVHFHIPTSRRISLLRRSRRAGNPPKDLSLRSRNRPKELRAALRCIHPQRRSKLSPQQHHQRPPRNPSFPGITIGRYRDATHHQLHSRRFRKQTLPELYVLSGGRLFRTRESHGSDAELLWEISGSVGVSKWRLEDEV